MGARRDWSATDGGARRCVGVSHKTGDRCKCSAVPGKDRCVWHGGGAIVLTGQYSKYLGTTLKQAVEGASTDTALVDELRLARGVLARALQLTEAMSERPALEMACLQSVGRMIADVREVAKSIDEQEARRSITPEQVTLVIHNILRVLTRHVTPNVLERVAEEMQGMKWPGGISCLPYEEAIGECISGT